MTLDRLPSPDLTVSWILGTHSLPGHIDPSGIALRWAHGSRTYGELRDRAVRLAGSLRRQGLQPGDRVGVHLFNRGETFELYFACAFAGLILVPISFRLTEREIGFIAEDAGPRIVVTEPELAEVLSAGLDAVTAEPRPLVIVLESESSGRQYEEWASGEPLTELAASDIHLLLYTSGTTGRPKGVELRHTNIMWCALQQSSLYDGMSDRPVTMLTGPMYNTAALNEQSIPTFLTGGTVAIMPSRGWKPRRMAELMSDWNVSHALVYPSMMEPLLGADDEDTLPLDSLRFVLTGGENCPPALMRRFKERWPHVSLCVAYGSTESGIVSLLWNEEIWTRPGSVGRPAGAQSLAVVDTEGGIVESGVVGEVVTAGPSVSAGYWNAPELTSGAFVGAWLRMGDLGRLDDEGYLFIVGRSRDMVISKGQNIYPAEVENVLSEHPGVADCSVVGVPDVEAGEAVCACIVVKTGHTIDAEEVRSFVQDRLASYKKPKHVVLVDELPRNPSGKVLKADLRLDVLEHIEEVRA